MKAFFLKSILLLLLPICSHAATAPEAWADSAKAAYDSGDFREALSHYQAIAQDHRSPSLYYNMGNAAYRAGELGKAILYFQKGRKMAPWDEDIQHNLELVQQELQDEFESERPKTLLKGFREFVVASPVGDWWTLALCFSLLLGGCLLLLGSANASWRNVLLTLSLLFLFLGGLAYAAERWKLSILEEKGQAVVLVPSVQVLHEPHESASTAFILHEGCSLERRKESKGWIEIRTPDGQVGWIPSDKLGKF